MRASAAGLVVSTVFASSATAILVTQGSPCDQYCGNVLSATTGPDIACDESTFTSSSAGVVLQSCMNCELSSTYSSVSLNQTDLQWLLYNSRFAMSWCLFGEPGNTAISDSPCVTSRACQPLQEAIQWANYSTSVGAYDYCQKWSSEQVPKCTACIKAGDNGNYLSNYLAMLDAGCQQQPLPGSTISVDGSVFSATQMNVTTPTPSNAWMNSGISGPLPLGGIVGVAAGGLCFILAVLGFCIVWNGRRRRRTYLKTLEMRHKDQGWPHPGAGGVVHRGGLAHDHGMNDTPLSQKPLTGWDDSPQSATASEPHYSRYFSPYSSQYNSPVSAADGPSHLQQWPQSVAGPSNSNSMMDIDMSQHHNYPSAAQEKALQDQHEADSQRSIAIGLALGGSEPSLRTQPSHPSVVGMENVNTTTEAYELHEVSSAGGSSAGGQGQSYDEQSFKKRMANNPPQAPMLQHPGYGRYSPDKPPPSPPALPAYPLYGTLSDEDVKHGNVV